MPDKLKSKITPKRCDWTSTNPLMVQYHDSEWGVPVHKDKKLFEFLILEGAQAGLNWETILNKRKNYHRAFQNFDPLKVALYGKEQIKQLLGNAGIIRNRLKIEGTVINARKFLEIQTEFGSFDKYIWGFVDGKPIKNKFKSLKELPAQTPESEAMSKDLKKRGFKFIGPTICYAFMQAVGMVNDHIVNCFRYKGV
ncbi:MAG TPA: DNA-3-methyladenine glycosylase I [candidate division Zixibacteria bacterium]|nr:DNA-3-methyladenine glycosylase I [candidate division Zixibacteria bacterium]